MTESVEFELEAEELMMMSSSLNDVVKLAHGLGIDKKFWDGKPKLLVIKAIRKCFHVVFTLMMLKKGRKHYAFPSSW